MALNISAADVGILKKMHPRETALDILYQINLV